MATFWYLTAASSSTRRAISAFVSARQAFVAAALTLRVLG
jgi:hypothetical protein